MARATSKPTKEDGQPRRPPVKRIAVVFVHGQGEQTPMTDVIELVESVWRTDPRAALTRAATASPDNLAETYSTPVYDEDFSDQRRVQSRIVKDQAGLGRQVDFYQFYWADLMKGNRFQHLWAWFTDLMRRTPSEIPKPIWPIRQVSMFLALGIGVWGAALGLLTSAALTTWDQTSGVIVSLVAALAGASQALQAHLKAQELADKAKAARASAVSGAITAAIGLGVLFLIGRSLGEVLIPYGLFLVGMAVLLAARAIWPAPTDWKSPAQGRAFMAWLVVLVFAVLAAIGLLVSGGQLFGAGELSVAKLAGLGLLGLSVFTAAQAWTPRRRATTFQLGLILVLATLAAAQIPAPADVDPASSSWPWILQTLGADATPIAVIREAAFLSTLVGAALLAGVGWWLNNSFLAPVMTDSARMFSNSPVNIPNQNAIRERGMKLLRALHSKGLPRADPANGRRSKRTGEDEPPYDRIIVLAHSLGTVVAYRLLTHYWGSVHKTLDGAADPQLVADLDHEAEAIDPMRNLNRRPGPPPTPLDDAARTARLLVWRDQVRAFWRAINPTGEAKSDWRISDFVTIGSPLTYASLLMEKNDRDFIDQVEVYKRYPTAPPQPAMVAPPAAVARDTAPPAGPPSMFVKAGREIHHGAMFAATCWTNLFFPSHGLANGDLIGGPLHSGHPHGLGPGVLDVDLDHDNSVQGFTHSEYWRWPARAKRQLRPYPDPWNAGLAQQAAKPPPPHVAAMRDALDLFDEGRGADERLLKPAASYPQQDLEIEKP